MTSEQHLIGLRVAAAYDLDPACVTVPRGAMGRIVEVSKNLDYIAVRLDEYIPGLEELGNCAIVTDADDEPSGLEDYTSAVRAFRAMFVAVPEPRWTP